jgi:hypothetical protein
VAMAGVAEVIRAVISRMDDDFKSGCSSSWFVGWPYRG